MVFYVVLAQYPELVSVVFSKVVHCVERGNVDHQRLPQVTVTHLDLIVNKVEFCVVLLSNCKHCYEINNVIKHNLAGCVISLHTGILQLQNCNTK